MKQTDRAFWVTVIPAVILWNWARPLILRWAIGNDSHSITLFMTANVLVSCVIAIAAGYVAAIVASPRHLAAACNVAVGVTIAFGVQNLIEHWTERQLYPVWYFALLPFAAAAAAVLGGALRTLQDGKGPGA